MKKVLIAILIVLLVALAYFAIFQGVSLGSVQILSVEQIIKANDELTNKINQTNSLQKKEFLSKKEELSTAVSELLEKKEQYFNLAKVSTQGEITKANTEETYMIEYLWARVGRHATSKGVKLKFDVITGETGEADVKNLAFTVEGKYVGIIDFIYAIEDDSELNFKIENFKMLPSGTNLIATFNVRNVRIKNESITVQVDKEEKTNTNGQESAQNNEVQNQPTNDNNNQVS